MVKHWEYNGMEKIAVVTPTYLIRLGESYTEYIYLGPGYTIAK